MKNNHQLRSFDFVPALIPLCLLTFVLLTRHVHAADAVTATAGISASAGSGTPVTGLSVSASIDSANNDAEPGVIGSFGGEEVKVEDMRKALGSLDPSEQAQIAADPGALVQAVRAILVERAIIKEASSKKWDLQPDVVAHLERVRESTLAGMYLQAMAQPPGDYPGDAEIKSAYDASKDSFTVAHQFRIAQILISIPATPDEAATATARKKLETVLGKLKKPDADFAKIAREESDEAGSAAQGGMMGWVDEKRMPPRIRYQAMTLPLNTVSSPIQITDGWHIIKVLESKDKSPLPLSEVRPRLVQLLRAQRAEIDRQAYVVNLLKKTPVTINEQAIGRVLKKAAAN